MAYQNFSCKKIVDKYYNYKWVLVSKLASTAWKLRTVHYRVINLTSKSELWIFSSVFIRSVCKNQFLGLLGIGNSDAERWRGMMLKMFYLLLNLYSGQWVHVEIKGSIKVAMSCWCRPGQWYHSISYLPSHLVPRRGWQEMVRWGHKGKRVGSPQVSIRMF